ncbi:hypothetical protein [Zavarzinia aquatilis]|uniref:TfoX N-terminal domain-containing protein n=1 Tax=Zavarzinia aquatilis TaxID=2211142 RepID=A0A317EBE2_9PROT|nr:hypothetical protein [Zavarzinia aquatilis]PWR22525.1 hypothetical protein DKG74_11660 [Zavarzinia aquatilis]
MAAKAAQHDTALFEAVFAHAAALDPEVRRGRMFGCPSVYRGRRMALCVFGAEIALRVPQDVASAAIEAGRAHPFQPYGRSPMREWIALEGGIAALELHGELAAAALRFARDNDGGSPRAVRS